MTMTRAQAAAYLQTQFDLLVTATGQAATDASAAGYGPDIDNALRQLGTAEASLSTATVADADVPAYQALVEYYALRRFARRLVTATSVSAAGISEQGQQMFEHVRLMLAEAAAAVAAYGYNVDGSAWGTVRYNLDYLEPEVAGV